MQLTPGRRRTHVPELHSPFSGAARDCPVFLEEIVQTRVHVQSGIDRLVDRIANLG